MPSRSAGVSLTLRMGTYFITSTAIIFELDGGQNFARCGPGTLFLAHLSGCAEFLKDHLGVAAVMGISVIVTHVDK